VTAPAGKRARRIAPPAPFGPTPSPRQLRWHARPFYGFIHFTVNTFTDREWGWGDEAPAVFKPSAFDADAMVRVAAEAGMSGLILTCKHHDGFCLWPSAHTAHSVRNSPWRNGRGDAVREVADACRRRGLEFGVYLSPWDRNHADYGRPAYLDYYRAQLEELTTGYGPVFEVWFDGANGGDGYYGGARERRQIDRKTYYDWPATWAIVRRNRPEAVLFSDAGPDVRWVGNEDGIAGDPCWATLDAADLYPGFGADAPDGAAAAHVRLNRGERAGGLWLPAECDVSIRPGWFYHVAEDDRVRSPDNLLDLYFQSVGRGASLLLNLPPDRRGLFHENDIRSLQGFRSRLDAIFGRDLARGASVSASSERGGSARFAARNLVDGDPDTYWAADDGAAAEAVLAFPNPVEFNVVSLREYLPLGQRVNRFALDVEQGGTWQLYAEGTSIGSRRLLRGPRCATSRLRLRVLDSPAGPALSEVALFLDPRGEEAGA
jgi:alpha-L-fucosidase